jgi:peptide deformylase (EC 3.5.1.88)
LPGSFIAQNFALNVQRMKLPILAYGHPLLRQPCTNISKEYPELEKLVAAMWETMHYANGCGLSAPKSGMPSGYLL